MGNQKVTQAVLVAQSTINPGQGIEQLALFDASGNPITLPLDTAQTGASVVLTGYTTHAAGAISATDTVDVALAKIEARLAAASIA